MLDLEKFKSLMNTMPGFNRHNGLRFTVVEEGYCECRVTMTPESFNPQGVAHGSLLFTLCDAVTGMAAATLAGGRSMLTQSASIHFLRPAAGGELIARSRVLRDGKTLALIKGEVFDNTGRLLAEGEFDVWFTGEPVVLPEEKEDVAEKP